MEGRGMERSATSLMHSCPPHLLDHQALLLVGLLLLLCCLPVLRVGLQGEWAGRSSVSQGGEAGNKLGSPSLYAPCAPTFRLSLDA